MSTTNIPIGDPFYLAAVDANADDSTYDFAVDGHPGAFAIKADAISALSDDVAEFSSSGTIYHCVAVARITPVPRVKVTHLGKQSKRTGA